MDLSDITTPLVKGNIMEALMTLLESSSHIDLLQMLLKDVDPETGRVILYIQGALAKFCEKAQKVAISGDIDSMFTSPTLKTIVHVLTIIPDTVETLLKGYFTQNLHKFLAHHQLPKLMRMFPAPFCMKQDILEKYLDLSDKQKAVLGQVCMTNWTLLPEEFMKEMIPMETHMAVQTGRKFNLTLGWDSTGCAVSSMVMWNWTRIMDVGKIMHQIKYLEENIDRALELFPRTSALLQLYLQPYLQGYPEFKDFPELYKSVTKVVDEVFSGKAFESVDGALHGAKHIAHFVKEFLNVESTHENKELLQVKPWVGKY